MWTGCNIMGLRWRWASRERDPGRLARPRVEVPESDGAPGDKTRTDRVKAAFLAREIVIDCPHPDCHGLLLTESRKFGRASGTASEVVLRCTREPELHEFSLFIEPCTAEERARLAQASRESGPVACLRCGTALRRGALAIADEWTEAVRREDGYSCPWCGVKWPLPERDESSCHQPG
jgi:DNA-directed RNA polymerase subunit RPC12/RpoP